MQALLAATCTALVLALTTPAFACNKGGSYHRTQQVRMVAAPAPVAAKPATPDVTATPIETTSPALEDTSSTIDEMTVSSAN